MSRYQNFSRKLAFTGQSFYVGLSYGEYQYVGEEWIYEVELGTQFRPDLISYKFYGEPTYWWIIVLHNHLKDPLFDLTTGTVLRIPASLNTVFERMKRGWVQPNNN